MLDDLNDNHGFCNPSTPTKPLTDLQLTTADGGNVPDEGQAIYDIQVHYASLKFMSNEVSGGLCSHISTLRTCLHLMKVSRCCFVLDETF